MLNTFPLAAQERALWVRRRCMNREREMMMMMNNTLRCRCHFDRQSKSCFTFEWKSFIFLYFFAQLWACLIQTNTLTWIATCWPYWNLKTYWRCIWIIRLWFRIICLRSSPFPFHSFTPLDSVHRIFRSVFDLWSVFASLSLFRFVCRFSQINRIMSKYLDDSSHNCAFYCSSIAHWTTCCCE